ncbi:hypothetical protein DPMN_108843 [Dreissena polymorpha]|uniref:Uncharacterized protein n=1 Tax=Dreissena polymorpha TaxID=45954 RepID=A0A9D4K977_DREPO|nr:hypothetical protein DPMN_108843 [Dreissena polymorpha]
MAISVQVFQCDGTSSVCGVESDVTDEMTLPLNFEPDSSYWRSSDHQLTFINRVR